MHWGLQYIIKEIMPKIFEELVTCARDMELSIATDGGKASVQELNKGKDK
jgi:hypothetical protein